MAEEHRCQAPKLCVNNCGFFGSPATQNLCSKCYRDLQLKEQQSSSAVLALNQTLASSSSTTSTLSAPSIIVQPTTCEQIQPSSEIETQGGETLPVTTPANKCRRCARRVGITGFKCRCGMTLCGSHRYPELHGCEFDFKEMGKDQIAKANPVVKADKVQKI